MTLSDFSGKRTYLMFFSVRNPASQSEMALAREIIMEYGQTVNFVAVSVDEDPSLVRDFAGQEDLLWQILMFGGTPDMLENFDATTLPHFLLIGPDGNIVRCPAPSPSENIRKLLDAG